MPVVSLSIEVDLHGLQLHSAAETQAVLSRVESALRAEFKDSLRYDSDLAVDLAHYAGTYPTRGVTE